MLLADSYKGLDFLTNSLSAHPLLEGSLVTISGETIAVKFHDSFYALYKPFRKARIVQLGLDQAELKPKD